LTHQLLSLIATCTLWPQGHHPAAFPFFYISPATPELNLRLTRKYTGDISQKEAETIAPIGNAPTMMTTAQLKQAGLLLNLVLRSDRNCFMSWVDS